MKKWIRTVIIGVVALLAVYFVIKPQFFSDTGEVKGVAFERVAGDISKALPETGSGEVREAPVKGMVTMLDLGADSCIPCKMMAPIMEKMERKYEGKAAVVFIDVWEHREQAARFGIRAIPTQIFFDADSKEVYRHAGFMSEKAIVNVMEQLGVTP